MQEKNNRLVINDFAINIELSSASFFSSLQTTRDSAAKIIFNKSKEKKTQVTQSKQIN